MREYQIAFFSWLWLLGAIVPARAQDKVPAAAQDDQKPTAKQATAPVEDGKLPERKRAAALPLSLEQAMTQAVRTNPDLLIAEAKVRQMEAELNLTRLAVARDVTVAYHKWENAKQKSSFDEKMHRRGLFDSNALAAARQELAECESELMYLLGIRGDADSDDAGSGTKTEALVPPVLTGQVGGLAPNQPAGRPEIPQRYREVMTKLVDLDFTDQPLSDILEYLQQATGGEFSFVFKDPDETSVTVTLTLTIKKVTFAAALEALADQTGWCFVFRDYGVLVVRREDAWQYRGAAIPSDTPLTMPGGKAGVRR